MFAKILLLGLVALVPSYFSFGLPPLPNISSLQNILSMRAAATVLQRRISYELLDENNIVGTLEQIQENHHLDPILFTGIICSSIWVVCNGYRFRSSSPPSLSVDPKIAKWESFAIIEKRVNRFVLIFMLIMTKNIENAI